MIRNYLLLAYRNLMKRKWFTVINICGLAIGMAVAILILNYVSFENSYDEIHQNSDRIYRVESQFFQGDVLTDDWATASFGYASAMKKHIAGIEDFVRIDLTGTQRIVNYKDRKFRENKVVITEPSFFSVFSFDLIEGDPDEVLKGANKVVITPKIAKKYFGNENPIGKLLTIRSSYRTLNCEVSGIIKEMPKNVHFDYEILISWETLPNWKKDFWYLHETYSYVLLSPNADPKQIEDSFPQMAEKYKTEEALRNKTWGVKLNPLTDIHLTPQKQYEREAKGNEKAITTLIIVALAILIIAWINYINLTTARSLERAKEVGVRKVSGAFRKQLIIQFMMESLMVNMISFIIASIFVIIALPLFGQLIGKHISFLIFQELLFWIVLSITFLAGLVLSGFYPAFVLSSVKPVNILKGKYVHSKTANTVRKTLVITQFAASLVLICGSTIVYEQLRFMQNQPLGVDINQTMAINFPGHTEGLQQKLPAFLKELKQMPTVENVSMSNAIPGMEVATFLSNHRADDPVKQNKLYEMLSVDFNYIDTYDLKMVAGRAFSKEFENDVNRIVINESAVGYLGFKNNEEALGKKVMLEGQDRSVEILGVVKNYHQQGLNKSYTPIMLIMYNRIGWLAPKYISVKLAQGNTLQATNMIKEKWQTFFPKSTFDHFFVDQYYNQQYQQDRRFAYVFGLFAILAIFIACLGLWALSLFSGLLRMKEMGVRKVLGATTNNLFYSLSKEFVFLISTAIVIGLPLSLIIMNNWLSNYAFRTQMKWWFFVLPVILVGLIAFLTISWQTIKTARSNPTESLCYE